MVEFSDEEGYGRFLDLHEYYNQYLNIKVWNTIYTFTICINNPPIGYWPMRLPRVSKPLRQTIRDPERQEKLSI